jgi:cell division protein FtsW (lipid II flippase)
MSEAKDTPEPDNKWRPAIGDLMAIVAIIIGVVVYLVQPNWEIGGLLALIAIALVIFAALRHTSHPILRWSVAVVVIAVFVTVIWRPIWNSFHQDYPTITWSLLERWTGESSKSGFTSAPTLPTSLPLQSRLERFLFTCDVPLPRNEQESAKQKERLQKNIQIWADSLGVDIAFADLGNGMQIAAEAKTLEAKARFLSMGILYGITKIIAEVRRNGGQQIIVVRAEIPKKTPMILGIVPDPSAPQIIEGKKLLAQFLEVPESACRLI